MNNSNVLKFVLLKVCYKFEMPYVLPDFSHFAMCSFQNCLGKLRKVSNPSVKIFIGIA